MKLQHTSPNSRPMPLLTNGEADTILLALTGAIATLRDGVNGGWMPLDGPWLAQVNLASHALHVFTDYCSAATFADDTPTTTRPAKSA